MAIVEIPLNPDIDNGAMTVPLGAVDFRLNIQWNTRDSRYYMGIGTAAGESIVESVPLVADTPLLIHYTDSRLPAGHLVLVDSTGAGEDPAEQDDHGDRWRLIFIPAGEA